jgi:hypothetical protein
VSSVAFGCETVLVIVTDVISVFPDSFEEPFGDLQQLKAGLDGPDFCILSVLYSKVVPHSKCLDEFAALRALSSNEILVFASKLNRRMSVGIALTGEAVFLHRAESIVQQKVTISAGGWVRQPLFSVSHETDRVPHAFAKQSFDLNALSLSIFNRSAPRRPTACGRNLFERLFAAGCATVRFF